VGGLTVLSPRCLAYVGDQLRRTIQSRMTIDIYCTALKGLLTVVGAVREESSILGPGGVAHLQEIVCAMDIESGKEKIWDIDAG
jgi:hypothetical protein